MDEQQAVGVKRRRTSAEIEQIVAEFADCGLKRSEFCRRQGMTLGTLNRYLKRLRPGSSSGAANSQLVAVELARGREGDGGLVMILSGGRRIEVGAGFDVSTLQRLVQALERM